MPRPPSAVARIEWSVSVNRVFVKMVACVGRVRKSLQRVAISPLLVLRYFDCITFDRWNSVRRSVRDRPECNCDGCASFLLLFEDVCDTRSRATICGREPSSRTAVSNTLASSLSAMSLSSSSLLLSEDGGEDDADDDRVFLGTYTTGDEAAVVQRKKMLLHALHDGN